MISSMVVASLASAGTPVVHDGVDDAAVIATVAQRTGLPTSQLDPVRLDSLLRGPPEALGEAVMRRCAQDTAEGDAVRTDLARAEVAWANEDVVSTMDHLDLAVARLGCLTSVVEGPVAGRVFLIRGAIAASMNEVDSARQEMHTAISLHPDLVWDPGLPAAGQAIYDQVLAFHSAARPDLAAPKVSVVPSNTPSGPWLDGREVGAPIRVSEGLHLAQYSGPIGIRSAWLSVGGDATLVLPGAFRRPVIEAVAHPEGRAALAALVAATLPELRAAYVAHGGGLWLVTQEGYGPAISEIEPMPVVEAPPETPKERKRRERAERKAARRAQRG